MINLKTNRLNVQILEPGEGENKYERFDRTCCVKQVTLDGKYDFMSGSPERLWPERPTGGMGLVSEIKCDDPSVEAGAGGWFPKFGVGLLYNEDGEKYSIRKGYKAELFDIEQKVGESEASFHVLPRECMGYALDEKRTVRLEGNTLTYFYEFKNVGSRPLTLGEYVHNFVTIEFKPIGPAYRLDAAVKNLDGRVPGRDNGVVHGVGNGLEWKKFSAEPTMLILGPDDFDNSRPFFWKLTNKESPAWVMEEASFVPAKAPVWSIDHIISFELYNSFSMEPGETVKYWRKWTFND